MLGVEALICVGGDGTLTTALQFGEAGIPVIGVPKTIDNDLKHALGDRPNSEFVIDPDGKIAKHYDKVKPDTHTEEVLADIKAFMAQAETS